jgi:hypothetical protein
MKQKIIYFKSLLFDIIVSLNLGFISNILTIKFIILKYIQANPV